MSSSLLPSFERWTCVFILCICRYDDYDYGEVNQLLERSLKVYIKTVTCYPERTTRRMYESYWHQFRHSEKASRIIMCNLILFFQHSFCSKYADVLNYLSFLYPGSCEFAFNGGSNAGRAALCFESHHSLYDLTNQTSPIIWSDQLNLTHMPKFNQTIFVPIIKTFSFEFLQLCIPFLGWFKMITKWRKLSIEHSGYNPKLQIGMFGPVQIIRRMNCGWGKMTFAGFKCNP